jgi:hypothetical protein
MFLAIELYGVGLKAYLTVSEGIMTSYPRTNSTHPIYILRRKQKLKGINLTRILNLPSIFSLYPDSPYLSMRTRLSSLFKNGAFAGMFGP